MRAEQLFDRPADIQERVNDIKIDGGLVGNFEGLLVRGNLPQCGGQARRSEREGYDFFSFFSSFFQSLDSLGNSVRMDESTRKR